MLGAGTVLDGRFEIEEIIGRGGMGAVYRARDKNNSNIVAIKELLVHLDNPYEKETAIKQFEREAKMLVRLSHPGIPEQLGYFVNGESAYLAMEYIQGMTLESIVCENEELPAERTVIEWGVQLCDVLEYLHELTPPIIFRDLKPSNVMLAGNQIKLIDFGIAKRLDPIMQTASILKGSGTPGYAPMEQYGKGSTDPRSDIYSLGATMYFLLTGRDPPQSVDIASGVDVLVPPRAYNPEISEAMEAAILRMMALKKEDRYQSATDAQEVLEACKTSIGLTVIRIPARGASDGTAPQQATRAVGTAAGALVEKPKAPSGKLPPPPSRMDGRNAGFPWLAVVAGVAALTLALYFFFSPPAWARPMVVRVVVDNDKEALRVEKDVAAAVNWSRHDETRVRETPVAGWALEVPAASSMAAEALGKSLKVAGTPVTRPDGSIVLRLTQTFLSQKEAIGRQKELSHRLARPVDVVHRTRREVVPVLVLETRVRGLGRADSLKKQLEDHQLEVTVADR